MTLERTCRTLLLGCLMMVAAGSAAHAQGPGGGGGMGGPGGGPGGGMGMPGGGGRMGGGFPRGYRGGPNSMGTRGGMTPSTTSGRWWDDRSVARSMGLKTDQQKRMDHVFTQNRDVLQQRYDAFVKAQRQLDTLKRSNNASESELFSQIEHTAQARAELEQAYTHMQLQIRGELTPEQASKLDAQQQH